MLEEIRPLRNEKLINLVQAAGFDVSEWGNYGGPAAANPKFCYEWCLEQRGMYLLNIWFGNMQEENGDILQKLNMREVEASESGPRKARARRFDTAMREAFKSGIHPRVVVLDRNSGAKSRVARRLLDPAPWTIRTYDEVTGAFELVRGIQSRDATGALDEELQGFPEGEIRIRFVKHRLRERRARDAKIAEFKSRHDGQLFCEVPKCGFDFEEKYGGLGRDYVQVHHKSPLSQAASEGVKTRLQDLAVVCANCHTMIHRGGQCREIETLVPARAAK